MKHTQHTSSSSKKPTSSHGTAKRRSKAAPLYYSSEEGIRFDALAFLLATAVFLVVLPGAVQDEAEQIREEPRYELHGVAPVEDRTCREESQVLAEAYTELRTTERVAGRLEQRFVGGCDADPALSAECERLGKLHTNYSEEKIYREKVISWAQEDFSVCMQSAR